MDVAEAEIDIIALVILDRGYDGIRGIGGVELCDLFIHGGLGLTALVADQTAGGIAETGHSVVNLVTTFIDIVTGELNTIQVGGSCIVAGLTLNALGVLGG